MRRAEALGPGENSGSAPMPAGCRYAGTASSVGGWPCSTRLTRRSRSCERIWWEAMIEKIWLTVQDAASYAAVSPDTIYTACERAELRHVKVGGRKAIRLRAEWIDGWLERYATGGVRDERGNAACLR